MYILANNKLSAIEKRQTTKTNTKMKSLINKKIYDTETAELITTHKGTDQDLGGESWDVMRTLYKTVKGNYFFYEVTEYTKNIHTISPEKVFDWLHKNQEIELINKYFPGQIMEG